MLSGIEADFKAGRQLTQKYDTLMEEWESLENSDSGQKSKKVAELIENVEHLRELVRRRKPRPRTHAHSFCLSSLPCRSACNSASSMPPIW